MKNGLMTSRTGMRFLDLAHAGLPQVPILGMHKLRRASTGLAMHQHPGRMEICYLAKGERIFHVGGRDYTLKGNDVFWTSGEETHGSGANADGKGLQYWIHLRLPATPSRFLTLSAQDSWPLVRALKTLPVRCFPGTLKLKQLFEDAFHAGANPRITPTQRLILAMHLVEWLCTVVECAQRKGAPTYSPPIRDALAWLETQEAAPSINAMAAQVHLSESRFKARFRDEVGIPPGEYIQRLMIRRAHKLLKATNRSVTDIAYTLGFSSSQYFATTFRRFTNYTPSEAREVK